MIGRAAFVLVVAVLLLGCKEEKVAPSEAYGCVNLFDGKEMSCTQLDEATTQEQRETAANHCVNQRLKQLSGRVVRQCPSDDVVARCLLPAEMATVRYYSSAGERELRGHRIGCKARGGTFEEGP